MLNMDIPYFYLNTSGKSLFGSEGEKIEDYFEYTSLEHLKKKIVLLDEDDLKRQLMFMNIILTEINEFQVEDKKIELQQMKMIPHREKNKAHLLKAVQKLADSLIKTAVFNKDRTEVNWIGVTLIGNEDDCSWDIRPLGTYLYEGMSGLAIFFNALYAVDPQKEYLIICNAIEKELFTYTDEMCERNEGIENESSGAFGGEASIMYTYEVLYKITNKEKYLDYAKKHYKILKKAITRDNSFDLVYGNAGAVITLINMYQLTGNKEYIVSAEIAGDIIVNAQEKEGSIKGGWNGDGRTSPLAGFSHGASGIVLALAKLWQVTQKEEYLLSLLDGIKFENSLFVKEKGNWKDERVYAGEKASDGGSFTVAWCHGAAGILLSRSKVNVILNGRYSDLIENDIKVAVNTILKEGILGNNCLCHGNLGNTEILFEYLKDHSDKKIEKYYVDIRDIIAENVCNGVFDCDNAYLYGYKLQLRDIKHNMKNNLISILAYAENKEYEKMTGFIEEIMGEGGMVIASISNSGNIVIDSLIGYWYVTAQNKRIIFKTDICIPMIMPFKGADLSLILGNLLENAVEAAEKVEENRYINVKMKFDKNNLLLFVDNSYKGKLLKTRDNRLKSTKSDAENHGVGLASVYRAVAKYHGSVVIEDSEPGKFKIRIVLYSNVQE